MNKLTTTLLLTTVVLTLSCGKKDSALPEHPAADTLPLEEVVFKPLPENDTVANAAPATEKLDGKELTVTGTVTEIMNGKDGYTAKLKAEDRMYLATISIPNMEKDFKRVTVGEVITVTGEAYSIEEDITIKVRKIK